MKAYISSYEWCKITFHFLPSFFSVSVIAHIKLCMGFPLWICLPPLGNFTCHNLISVDPIQQFTDSLERDLSVVS